MEELLNLDKIVDKEIGKIAQKGDLSLAELQMAKEALCVKEKIQHLKQDEMMYANGNSGYYRPMMDYSYGASYARGRDNMTGQYVSRDGRSYGNEMPNEYDRPAMDRYMSGMMR